VKFEALKVLENKSTLRVLGIVQNGDITGISDVLTFDDLFGLHCRFYACALGDCCCFFFHFQVILSLY